MMLSSSIVVRRLLLLALIIDDSVFTTVSGALSPAHRVRGGGLVQSTPEDHVVYEVDVSKGRRNTRTLTSWGGSSSSSTSSSSSSAGSCPTSNKYSEACLQASIPPYPICLSKTVDEFVKKTIQGYTNCCGEDFMANCKCPKKNSQQFISKISDWCAHAETCSDTSDGDVAAASSSVVSNSQIENDVESDGSSSTTRMNLEESQQQQEEETNDVDDDNDDDDNIWDSNRHSNWSSEKRKSSTYFNLKLLGLLLGIVVIRYFISFLGCCSKGDDDDDDKETDTTTDDETLVAGVGVGVGPRTTTGGRGINNNNNDISGDIDDDKTETMSDVSEF